MNKRERKKEESMKKRKDEQQKKSKTKRKREKISINIKSRKRLKPDDKSSRNESSLLSLPTSRQKKFNEEKISRYPHHSKYLKNFLD